MDEGADFGFELVTLILALAMSLPFFMSVVAFLLSPDFGGFDSQIMEKTAIVTYGELIPQQRVIDRDDMMLMLAVADKYAMAPLDYTICGYDVAIDDTYFNNRAAYLINAFAAMDVTAKKITLYYGPTGPRKWVIENK